MADQIGVTDYSGSTGSKPVHTEQGPSLNSSGIPLDQQVVQLDAKRGLAQVIELLTSIDNRLAVLEENANGFSQ